MTSSTVRVSDEQFEYALGFASDMSSNGDAALLAYRQGRRGVEELRAQSASPDLQSWLAAVDAWISAHPEAMARWKADQVARSVPVVCPSWCTETHPSDRLTPYEDDLLHQRHLCGDDEDTLPGSVDLIGWQCHPDTDPGRSMSPPSTAPEISIWIGGTCVETKDTIDANYLFDLADLFKGAAREAERLAWAPGVPR